MKPKIIREAAVAGTFYPADPGELRDVLDGYLDSAAKRMPARSPEAATPPVEALIAPHAGYVYSGPIAASAYRHWRDMRGLVRRVILLGPSHRSDYHGLAASGADAFATPLGCVPVDREAIGRLCRLPQVRVMEAAHRWEHSLEVQIPFLQHVLGDFALVPLLVGEAADEESCEALDLLWKSPTCRVVVSSDLSHYHDSKTANQRDRATSDAIETLCPEKIEERDACGCRPIRALLRSARRRGLLARTVDQRNSSDTAGAPDRVVGYGAYIFTGESPRVR
ncbi:MAG: AmmeMemoRadiSam system protein B [Verrucomicrobia bacterium]|nr:AmmeMemoRadiSam system protein B [Verrucomicrobiota bacterium]